MLQSFLDNFFNVGQQVVVLFIMIATGALCRWLKLLSDEAVKGMTNIALFVVTPCIIIISFQHRPFSTEDLALVGVSALIGFGFHFVSILLAHLLIHDKDASRRAVLRFATVFSNAGFMSLPLQQAILGNDGVFCGAVVVGTFQFVVWTYGVWTMGGAAKDMSLVHIFLNPGIISVIIALVFFVLQIELPQIFCHYDVKKEIMTGGSMWHLANLNTPLPMLIIGYHLAGVKLGEACRDWKMYLSIAIRLIISPLITLGILLLCMPLFKSGFLPQDKVGTMIAATVIAACAPVAAITTMFAVRYGHNPVLSVELVSLSTLASVVTMPLVVGAAMAFSK